MMIKLPDTACTGCGACLNACRTGALTMKSQEDGFVYPYIDSGKCVQCGQCMKVCHILGKPDMNQPSVCYAAQIENKDLLFHSTSGGMFSALASAVIREKGTVYGCVFDEYYHATISRAETMEQIIPMHGSKYVWSDPALSFPQVKKDLEGGRQVLYTCLPCQGAGLRKYLGKEYDNLFLVDIICGGAPSPYAFQKYLETITDEAGKNELHFKFRDKDRFGSGVNCTYYVHGVKHYENYLENSFYYAFSSKSRIVWRRSCYECNYKSLNRISDLTIGDYWGVEKHHSTFRPRDGVSLVLVSTDKGRRLFERVKKDIRYEESQLSYITEKNSLVDTADEGHVIMPENRADFFYLLQTDGWTAADRKYLSNRKKQLFKLRVTRIPRKIVRVLDRKGR